MKRVSLAAGVLSLCVVWSPALSGLSANSFTAHMAVHMTVVAVAAPLIALGLGGSRLPWMPSLLLSPIVASLVELVIVWGWHAPALHHAARHSEAVFAAEQTSFLIAGLLLWCAVLDGRPRSGRRQPDDIASSTGIIALLLTFSHMTLLGALLSLSPRPLYHHASSVADALFDQQLGGSLMLVVSAVVYTAGGLWLGYRSLQREVWVRS